MKQEKSLFLTGTVGLITIMSGLAVTVVNLLIIDWFASDPVLLLAMFGIVLLPLSFFSGAVIVKKYDRERNFTVPLFACCVLSPVVALQFALQYASNWDAKPYLIGGLVWAVICGVTYKNPFRYGNPTHAEVAPLPRRPAS
jgi:hypothetical protein